jgi:hypothetical protein
MKALKKTSPTYQKVLNHFRKQFFDVVDLTKIFINSDDQVYAGEWIDSYGITNINSGYLPDLKTVILIIN